MFNERMIFMPGTKTIPAVIKPINKSCMTILPSLDQVVEEAKNYTDNYRIIPIIIEVSQNDRSCESSKRITSVGEKARYKRMKKYNCPVCGKYISKKTTHPSTACQSYLLKARPEVTLETSESVLASDEIDLYDV
jgi:predicted RNA-binding Zn-ribbon protein involved in translation (DUF1610 family)